MQFLDSNTGFGYLGDSTEKIVRALAGTGSATADATSGKYIPQSDAEFISLSLTVPSNLWRFHAVSSGNVPDTIGTKTLTMSGSPNYARTFSGWTSTGIGASGAAANQFCSNTTMPDVSGTSSLLIAYAQIATPGATNAERMHHGAANTNSFQTFNSSNVMRLRNGGNSGQGSLNHVGQVRPYVVLHDRTNSVNAIYSNIEKKAITYASASGTEVLFQFGLATDTLVDSAFIWACLYTGVNAEKSDAQIKAILTTLGWTVSGY